MIGLRALISTTMRARPILKSIQTPVQIQKRGYCDHDGSTQPFDNMPFSVPNRYAATAFFAVFFGIGLWAPFLLLWYMMAKKTL